MSIIPRLKQYRNPIAATHDCIMAAASFVLALYLRLGNQMWQQTADYLLPGAVIFTAISFAVFMNMRLYKNIWRYASLNDLVAIAKASLLSVAIFLPLLFMFTRLEGYPRSALFITLLLMVALLGAPRLVYRIVRDRGLYVDWDGLTSNRVPVLVIGAGDQAELFVRDTVRREDMPYRVVGLVGDDKRSIGRNIHGVRVYGDFASLSRVIEKLTRKNRRPHKIIIADDTLQGPQIRQVLDIAEAQGMSLARLPKLTDLQDATVQQALTPIAIEDLLGRPQTALDLGSMEGLIKGRRVMVTGAGGTIGSELTRQIVAFSPQELIVVDISEYALYSITQELAECAPNIRCTALLGDVRDQPYVQAMFRDHRPDLVFHAAAIKHVPIAEQNPHEAVLTNVIGTRNVAEAAREARALAMVMISTDKAVNPTSLMGATKRLAEYTCQALGDDAPDKHRTHFLTVRFGNVLGSTGSVVPLFSRQLEQGGPLTVTHPDMTRYFMTVREAVTLVIQAAAGGIAHSAVSGRIYVLDMGKPVRIMDLAEQMIRLAGLIPGQDIGIETVGIRTGEKLYEELFYADEHPAPTDHDGIMLATPRRIAYKTVRRQIEALEKATAKRDTTKLLALLREAVPDFRPMADNDAQPEPSGTVIPLRKSA